MVTRLDDPPHDDTFDTEPTEPDPEQDAIDLPYNITSYPADYTLRVLNAQIEEQQLVLPHFQRGYVWSPLQASRLIESFLMGLPVPEIFLYRERSTEQRLVVDGHQRLATISSFFKGYFPNDRPFLLRGVDSRWDNKRYTDLDEPDKLRFDNSTLRSIIIQQEDPNDHSSMYLTFERLNTGGTRLSSMEIRRAQFPGSAYNFLEHLNTNEGWRTLIGTSKTHPRLRDVELVLRVIALATNRHSYKKPLKLFLNDYMRELRDMSSEERAKLGSSFSSSCSVATSHLPAKPFHIRRGLNMAALDSILGTLMNIEGETPPGLAERFNTLVHDQDFLNATEAATSDEDSIRRRFARAQAILAD